MTRILVLLLISSGLSAQTMVLKSAQGVDPREGCLTTSLAAYQAASNNTFVSCTSTEYACIQAKSTTYGATNAGMDNPFTGSGDGGGSMFILDAVPSGETLLGFRFRPQATFSREFYSGPTNLIFSKALPATSTSGGQRWYVYKGDETSNGTYVWGMYNFGNMWVAGGVCNTYYQSSDLGSSQTIPSTSNTSNCYAIQSLWKQKTW